MLIDTIGFILTFAILGALAYNMHKVNVAAHIRTQEILENIARFLGTDRR
jgi:hypothetical protein